MDYGPPLPHGRESTLIALLLHPPPGSAELDSKVDRGLEPGIEAKLLNLKGWRGYNNPWMAEGEQEEEFLYINLLTNPERYTGYKV